MSKFYIAYGSNLNIRQMKYRCPTAKLCGVGRLQGLCLLFKGSRSGSYLTVESCDSGEVPVAVWKVKPSDEIALDRYEGYPTFYYKKDMDVEFTGIKSKKPYKVKAFIYIMHEERKLGIPSQEYVKVCLEGYDTFGFDYEYIKEAYMKSWRNEENGK